MNENKVRVGMKWKRELGKKETYGEGINLVLGEGVGVVGTHAKHGDIDTVREKEIYIKMKKTLNDRILN